MGENHCRGEGGFAAGSSTGEGGPVCLGNGLGAFERVVHRQHRQHVVTTGIDGNAVMVMANLWNLVGEPRQRFAHVVPARLGHQLAQTVAVCEQEGVEGGRCPLLAFVILRVVDGLQHIGQLLSVNTLLQWTQPLVQHEILVNVIGVEFREVPCIRNIQPLERRPLHGEDVVLGDMSDCLSVCLRQVRCRLDNAPNPGHGTDVHG